MTSTEKKARALIAGLSENKLIEQWEMTGKVMNAYACIVRGWLMDEFDSRYPEAFSRWLDNDAEDETLKDYIRGAR